MPIADLIEIVRTASASEMRWYALSQSAAAGSDIMQLRHDSSSFTAPPADRIVVTPGVCGGRPRISGTRVPVDVLLNYRSLGLNDSQILEGYPAVTAEDLAAAWAYAEKAGLVR
jgi:uncharacterized protein (DUF433 family)